MNGKQTNNLHSVQRQLFTFQPKLWYNDRLSIWALFIFKYLLLNNETILFTRTCAPTALFQKPSRQYKTSSWQRFSAGQTECCALIVVNTGRNHMVPQSNKLNHQIEVQNPWDQKQKHISVNKPETQVNTETDSPQDGGGALNDRALPAIYCKLIDTATDLAALASGCCVYVFNVWNWSCVQSKYRCNAQICWNDRKW